jgi:hypothetical protein
MPKRSAMPGRCQTGSTAALLTLTSTPWSMSGNATEAGLRWTTFPSTGSAPLALAASSSDILMWARVHEMVGRASSPPSIWDLNSVWTMWPQGSSETIRLRSDQAGWGGSENGGCVLV